MDTEQFLVVNWEDCIPTDHSQHAAIEFFLDILSAHPNKQQYENQFYTDNERASIHFGRARSPKSGLVHFGGKETVVPNFPTLMVNHSKKNDKDEVWIYYALAGE